MNYNLYDYHSRKWSRKCSCLAVTAFLLLAPNTLHLYASPNEGIYEKGVFSVSSQDKEITGTITDDKGEPIIGASVRIKGKSIGVITDMDGAFKIQANDNDVLIISYIGFQTKTIAIRNKKNLPITLSEDINALEEVVVVGYGTKLKGAIISAVSSVGGDDLEKVHASTISATLAGKLPGVSFRMPDGRPGAAANIQIRNLGGDPLFIIDGVQQDKGSFNQIAANDIESISVLKDASAAIYGVRAANGVVLVTTKKGKTGKPQVNLNAYYGWQNMSEFPKNVNAYEWFQSKAEGEMNQNGKTSVTPEELGKWRDGTEPGYQSFDWYDYVVQSNAPQSSVNVNVSGGTEAVKYYFSLSQLDQDAVFDKYKFGRTNIQSNIDAKVGNLNLSMQINGRREVNKSPAQTANTDDYFASRLAMVSNLPYERPYANDNPDYPAYLSGGSGCFNTAVLDGETSGYKKSVWSVLQTNFAAEYHVPFVPGLAIKAMYSYYIADNMYDNFQYAYDLYTYDKANDSYIAKGGNSVAKREKSNSKAYNSVWQAQISYNRTFGKHNVSAILVNERQDYSTDKSALISTPNNNILPNMEFADMTNAYSGISEQARIGYIGRLSYDFSNRYYAEFLGRYDGSWKFPKKDRWAFFPSGSIGWRITEEPFYKKNLSNKIIQDLKLRASFGILGDDNPGGYGEFGYIKGYTNNSSTVVLDGELVTGVRDRGAPTTNISWVKSYFFNAGLDYTLLDGKITGTIDYFHRKRTGIAAEIRDVTVPSEIGYSLPWANLNKDKNFGGEFAIAYHKNTGDFKFTAGGNISYSRRMYIDDYKKTFGNSWDYYRNSSQNRYTYINWGYQVIGQFQSQNEINDYPVNIDGKGNKTILPGDFIYKDVNEDGYIDDKDMRPIGYQAGSQPIVNFGLNFSASYKNFDIFMDFAGGSVYSLDPNWSLKWPFQNGSIVAKETQFDNRWHREDPFDLSSPWIPGSTPALRITARDHVNYNRQSDYFLKNVNYLRLKTLEIGYSLPREILSKVGIQKTRFYVNASNLFTFDNVGDLGVDPEITDRDGLQYPQTKMVNLGVNIVF